MPVAAAPVVPDPDGAAVPSELVPGAPALVPNAPPLAAPGEAPDAPPVPPDVWAKTAVDDVICKSNRPAAIDFIVDPRHDSVRSIGSTGRCSVIVEPDVTPPVIGRNNVKGFIMSILKWALIFFLISLVAGVFGFTGLSAASADIARVLFYIFGVIFLILLILGFTIFRA